MGKMVRLIGLAFAASVSMLMAKIGFEIGIDAWLMIFACLFGLASIICTIWKEL